MLLSNVAISNILLVSYIRDVSISGGTMIDVLLFHGH